ncbi:MAG TPA: hypothetical protein VIO94_16020 [Phenylobacterium sp.]
MSEGIGVHQLLTANVPVTWSITGGAQAADFSLDGDYLDLPAPAQDGTYQVEITATRTSSSKTASQLITVTVIALTITSSDSASGVEGTALVQVLSANEPVTWAKIGGADQASFTLVGDTLTLPDTVADGTYVVQIEATSLDGLRTADQTFTATLADSGTAPEIPYIAPGPLWTGTAESGYAGDVPTDVPREHAKGVVQVLHQADTVIRATDTLIGTYGGAAWSEDGEDQYLIHCEGNVYDVTPLRKDTYTDVNGVEKWIIGHLAKIRTDEWPVGTYGVAHIYYEIRPANPGVQPRIIGPYKYYHVDPANPKLNVVVTFDKDAANDTPSNPLGPYKTLLGALKYAKTQLLLEPEIRCLKTGDYWPGNKASAINSNLTGTRLVITADPDDETVVCTIKNPVANSASDDPGSLRTGYNGLEFRGARVIVDQINTRTMLMEAFTGTNNVQHCFNGCTLTNSMGRYPLFRGYTLGAALCAGNPIYRDCAEISDIRGDKAMQNCGMSLNNWNLVRLPSDVFVGGNSVYGNRGNDFRVGGYADNLVSARIRYTGSGTWTVRRYGGGAGGANAPASASGTFEVSDSSGASFSITTNTYIQSLADGVNALADWEFENFYDTGWTSVDDRSLQAISVHGSGKQGNTFTRTGTGVSDWIELVTSFDIHGDIGQTIPPAVKENIVFAFNQIYNTQHQFLLLQSTASVKAAIDWVVENNCFHTDYPGGTLKTQLQTWGEHIVFRHNSLPNQVVSFNKGSTVQGFTHDDFCEMYGNVFAAIEVDAGSMGEYPERNHLMGGVIGTAGSSAKPTDYTSGGTMADLIASAATGDFTPQGALLSPGNLVTSRSAYDANGNARAASDARGAVAAS